MLDYSSKNRRAEDPSGPEQERAFIHNSLRRKPKEKSGARERFVLFQQDKKEMKTPEKEWSKKRFIIFQKDDKS
jgi:hypothetical protein